MNTIPYHLGIILDGNRRWAEDRGLPVFEGHRQGSEKVKKALAWCKDKGIKILTLFVFSTENWSRPKPEINFLMNLLKKFFNKKNIQQLNKEGIRVKMIGQLEKLPPATQNVIKDVENLTRANREMVLNFALSYGGRAEIIEAIKKIIEKKTPVEKIDENVISENLWTSDVDLIIRTGKEQRISNFLIWQAAYSELFFTNKYWPDFTEKDLEEALLNYASRQRRFGK